MFEARADGRAAPSGSAPVLHVTVTGGGPVGLSFALLLDYLMGPRAAIKVYDSRWIHDGGRIVWKTPEQGNVRRQQVVTIQSRQYLKLPPDVQERLFIPGAYTEMWPKGPDSIQDLGPRNVRLAKRARRPASDLNTGAFASEPAGRPCRRPRSGAASSYVCAASTSGCGGRRHDCEPPCPCPSS